ncbi:MAG: hypothetical protein M1814_006616 [Vezdaea aestivalis]|nr:MAG: hypothetical protein M1814_006616 [Vezdaea aestivalis]
MVASRRPSQADFSIFEDRSVLSSTASQDPYCPSSPAQGKFPRCDEPIASIEPSYSSPRRGALTPPLSNGPSGDEALGHEDDGPEYAAYGDDDEISNFPSEAPLSPRSGSLTSSPLSYARAGVHRSPFRNPSSVRAMQNEHSPPPFNKAVAMSPRYRLEGSRHGSPRSVRSTRKEAVQPVKKKEYPLILLHITLLPLRLPAPLQVMREILPAEVVERYVALRDKIDSTTLDRGVLIPHPREDYELLEERLLESLDLKVPRILKCGHFRQDDCEESQAGDEEHQCDDCARVVRDGPQGLVRDGHGAWEVQIFAANGLMRAGAWAAAWQEMERVDVEIRPWVEEDSRKKMKVRNEEDEKVRAQRERDEKRRVSEERLREIYGVREQEPNRSEKRELEEERTQTENRHPQAVPLQDVDLLTLLRNYVFLLGQDSKNIIIAAMVVLMFAMTLFSGGSGKSGVVDTSIPAPPVQTVTIIESVAVSAATPPSIPAASVIQPTAETMEALLEAVAVPAGEMEDTD